MTQTGRGSFSDNKHAAVSPLHFAAVRDQNPLAVMWDHTHLCPAHTQKKWSIWFLTRKMLGGREINIILHTEACMHRGYYSPP